MDLKRTLILLAILLIVSISTTAPPAMAQPAQRLSALPIWNKVVDGGFGNPLVGSILSMAVFGDHLYAGASSGGIAQIWRTSNGTDWVMVDNRGLQGVSALGVYNGSLYAGSWNGHIWASPDGLSWTEVIDDGFGDPGNKIERLVVYQDRFYAATINSAGAELWYTSDGSQWDSLFENGFGSPLNQGIGGMQIFNNLLYMGIENQNFGSQLWYTEGVNITRVTEDGFGDIENWAIPSLAIYENNLYASMWNLNNLEVWRSPDGDQWDQVVDGLGIPPDVYTTGLEPFNGKLYLTVSLTSGARVYRSDNGTSWELVNEPGFGNPNNTNIYTDKAIAGFKGKLYVGASNSTDGAEIWQMTEVKEIYMPLLTRR